MNTYSNLPPFRSRARHSTLLGLAVAAALGLGACQAAATAVPTLPSLAIPTIPASPCIDAPTWAIISQLRATGADTPTILATNKPALVAGLQRLHSSDANTTAWRDALVTAVNSNDVANVALQIAKLSSGQVTVASC
jgi:hypothetical protein